jgi:hypothetical protein
MKKIDELASEHIVTKKGLSLPLRHWPLALPAKNVEKLKKINTRFTDCEHVRICALPLKPFRPSPKTELVGKNWIGISSPPFYTAPRRIIITPYDHTVLHMHTPHHINITPYGHETCLTVFWITNCAYWGPLRRSRVAASLLVNAPTCLISTTPHDSTPHHIRSTAHQQRITPHNHTVTWIVWSSSGQQVVRIERLFGGAGLPPVYWLMLRLVSSTSHHTAQHDHTYARTHIHHLTNPMKTVLSHNFNPL